MIIRSSVKAISISFMLGASALAHAATPNMVPEAIQDSLIEWSASDFSAHGPSVAGVRNVHVRYQTLASGEPSYVLCGEFRSGGDAKEVEWTHFATIKTDPYEQWIGGLAQSHCEQATVISTQPADLSALLQARLHSVASK